MADSRGEKLAKKAVKRGKDNIDNVGDVWEGTKWVVKLIRNPTDTSDKLYQAVNKETNKIYRVNISNMLFDIETPMAEEIDKPLEVGKSLTDFENTEEALEKLNGKEKV